MRPWRNARFYRRPLAGDDTAAGHLDRAAWRVAFSVLTVTAAEAPSSISASVGAWRTVLLVTHATGLAAAAAVFVRTPHPQPIGHRADATEEREDYTMGLLTALGTGQGYLKAGFLGFQKSGKTYTATALALGVREFFGLQGPLAFFDTEGGAEFVAPWVKRATGTDLVGVRSRSFDDMVTFGHECVAAGVAVAVVDSVTHTWRELCDAYLAQVNARRKQHAAEKRWTFKPQRTLEFQDWGTVKGLWNDKWTSFYLNSPLHLIICGRAGYEYDFEETAEGKRELVKTGVKMRTEAEFGFEPALLVEMERHQVARDGGGYRLERVATVIGDRFGVLDGQSCANPTFAFFVPRVRLLKAGAHAPVDTTVKTDTGVDEEGSDAWARERRTRTILAEEIQGELVAVYPGQTAAEKKAKGTLLAEIFHTRSWTAVEGMDSERLRAGLAALRERLGRAAAVNLTTAPVEPATEPEPAA